MRQVLALVVFSAMFALPDLGLAQSPVGNPPKSGAASSATAAQRKPNLDSGECSDLGGKVIFTTICTYGKACTTTDEKGKGHIVCLSK
jgi:hypothetical protein